MAKKNVKPKIVRPENVGRMIPTVTSNTGLSQRETLEAIMLNLAYLLDTGEIYKQTSARGAEFYCVGKRGSYQSATNTILDMSKQLCDE